ncbi:GTP-binding protein HflX [Rickettsiales bacterium Ac37b]|nr:GTP-binding protein HflX [Rickettsiales bacterium Ac37b]
MKKDFVEYKAKDRLAEAVALAKAINLEIVLEEIVILSKISSASFIGSGKVSEYANIIKQLDVTLVIIDEKVSPIQQRNLEKAWKCKVIERTALIIEIFGDRAKTKEGKLQVNLAHFQYQKSRLVRTWTHLERQRGGHGFLAGPGEKQIEVDRRIITQQITKIKRELEKIKLTRAEHRKSRQAVPYPIISLVGYTNTGKTTLFNRLTGAKLLAADMLFATLDPTMRIVTLPSRKKIILSDTVGFISDLPTELIVSFRATLEEVKQADLILHVQDISSPNRLKQKEEVNKILVSLGTEDKIYHHTIEVLNKMDLLEETKEISNSVSDNVLYISASTGINCDKLLEYIDHKLSMNDKVIKIEIENLDGKVLAWIYSNSAVIERQEQEDKIYMLLRISEKNYQKLLKNFTVKILN